MNIHMYERKAIALRPPFFHECTRLKRGVLNPDEKRSVDMPLHMSSPLKGYDWWCDVSLENQSKEGIAIVTATCSKSNSSRGS